MVVDLRKAHAEGLNAAVAAELRAEKAAQNLTNQDIAVLSGIPIVSVQRYLAPKRAIDLVVLEQLSRAVGKTPTEIVAAAEQRLARSAALQENYEASEFHLEHARATRDNQAARADFDEQAAGAMPRLRGLLEDMDEREIAQALGVRLSVVQTWWKSGMDRPLSKHQLKKLAEVSRVAAAQLLDAMLVDVGWLDPPVEDATETGSSDADAG